jgi:predicted dehydrogenase
MTRGRAAATGRRGFLAATALGGFAALRPGVVFGSRANEALRVGIVGCGGRGSWLAGLFERDGRYKVTACADYFADRVDACAEKHGVAADRRFTGLSGYRRLLETDVDAVVIETPPYFHPEQAAAAVEAGKHVFLAKPIAVDVPGCRTVEASAALATRKKLVFLVDFQTRTNPHHIEVARRVHAGEIGTPISGEANYLWSMIVHPDPAEGAEAKLRSWYQSRALSGDAIVEQDIHTIDVATWLLDAAPESAVGCGGRAVRKHGETWDHASVIFRFPKGVHVAFASQKGVPGIPDSIRCALYGTDGVADTDYSGPVFLKGNRPYAGGSAPGIYEAGAVANIGAFYDRVTGGDFANATVAPSVRSNLACILGRTAAYAQGREVTWAAVMAKGEELEADLRGLKG